MSRKIYILSFLFLCLLSKTAYSRKIKDFILEKDAITMVRTSPGYTTLIELPDKPSRIVIGDQDSFKVEFVGNNLAIKPLVSGVQTNLFVFTKTEQYHATLVSGPRDQTQYIVRLNHQHTQPKKLSCKRIRNDIEISLTEYQRPLEGNRRQLFFTIKNKRLKSISLDPERLNLSIGSAYAPISSVYIDKLDISPDEEIHGSVTFLTKENISTNPLNFKLALKGDELLHFPFTGRDFQ